MDGSIYGEENTGYYVANGNSATVNPESDSYHSFSVCLCINDVNLTSGSHTLAFDTTTKNTHHLNANAYDGTSLATKTASVGTNTITFTIGNSCTKLFWSISSISGDTVSNVTLDGKKCKFV